MLASALAAAAAYAKKFNVKVFYVMGKALSGELSCPCDRSCHFWRFNCEKSGGLKSVTC